MDFTDVDEQIARLARCARICRESPEFADLAAEVEGVIREDDVAGPGRFALPDQWRRAGGGAPAVSLAAVPAAGAAMTDTGDQDSEHRVYIDIRGAAPGTRTGIESSAGPAKLSLRTSYAMGAPFA